MSENEIRKKLQNGENETLECKRAKYEVPNLVNSLIVAYL